MVTFDPSQALTILETALRQLMRSAYPAEYGPGWLERVSSPEQRTKWESRREAEGPKRRGVARAQTLELDFSELWELNAIAKKHWPPLSKALGGMKSTMPMLETFERLRNAVGHSRALQPFEQELLSGIAGSIRNQVTINLSATDSSGEYYPRIETISDSYGNVMAPSSAGGEIAGSADTGLVLHPGDVVIFTCLGVDPQGRDLLWVMDVRHTVREEAVASAGDLLEFRWEVEERDVAEHLTVGLVMSAAGVKYHRANGFDHRAWFAYKVRPLDHP